MDYQLIDHTQPVELVYGIHVLKIEADGYDVWKKYLSVNSDEATVIIELTKSEDDSKEETEKNTETESEKESEKNTESEKESEETEESTESLESTEI